MAYLPVGVLLRKRDQKGEDCGYTSRQKFTHLKSRDMHYLYSRGYTRQHLNTNVGKGGKMGEYAAGQFAAFVALVDHTAYTVQATESIAAPQWQDGSVRYSGLENVCPSGNRLINDSFELPPQQSYRGGFCTQMAYKEQSLPAFSGGQ